MRVNSFAAVQLCFRTREDADQLERFFFDNKLEIM
jgi:hypothetical protein